MNGQYILGQFIYSYFHLIIVLVLQTVGKVRGYISVGNSIHTVNNLAVFKVAQDILWCFQQNDVISPLEFFIHCLWNSLSQVTYSEALSSFLSLTLQFLPSIHPYPYLLTHLPFSSPALADFNTATPLWSKHNYKFSVSLFCLHVLVGLPTTSLPKMFRSLISYNIGTIHDNLCSAYFYFSLFFPPLLFHLKNRFHSFPCPALPSDPLILS